MTRSLSRVLVVRLSLAQNVLVKVSSNDGKLSFEPANESREANAMSGTIRQLVNNMVSVLARVSKRS
jgi:ribosomal protein L6P/L9E